MGNWAERHEATHSRHILEQFRQCKLSESTCNSVLYVALFETGLTL